MRIPVNTSLMTLIAGGAAAAVVRDRSTGELAIDPDTKQVMYSMHLTAFVLGDPKPQVWLVKTAGEPPTIVQGQAVRVEGLVASDWEHNGRHGVSFRADAIAPAAAPVPANSKAAA